VKRHVLVRHPTFLRVSTPLMCGVMIWAVVAAPPHALLPIIGLVLSAVLAILILAYKVEVNELEVTIRYAPFLARSVRLTDVQHVEEKRTSVVLVTPTSKVLIRELSPENAHRILHALSRREQVMARGNSDAEDSSNSSLRLHLWLTAIFGICFAAASLGVVRLLKGHPWSHYWVPWGQRLILLDMFLFLSFVREVGMSFVYWYTGGSKGSGSSS
jgi:hypothetical protein